MIKEVKPRYPYLDALRGIAVMLVIMHHTTIFMVHSSSNILYRIAGEGARGVQIFYIVSALTLFMSLSTSSFSGKKIEQIKFFIRRFFRIAPMFYFTILIFTIIGFLFPFWKTALSLDFNTISLLSSLTFTNNFFPQYMNSIVPGQWSVAIEMLFYLIVPILFLRIKNLRDAKRYFIWALILASLIEFFLPALLPSNVSENVKIFLFYTLPIQIPTFILGFIAFFLLHDDNKENKDSTQKQEFFHLLLIVLLCEIIFFTLKLFFFGIVDISLITPRIYVQSVLFLGLVILFSNGYLSLLQNKVFQYVGKLSYSVYLVQFISFMLITKNNIYPAIAVYFGNAYVEYIILSIGAIALSVLISSITFKYIEMPGQKLGSYLSKRYTAKMEDRVW